MGGQKLRVRQRWNSDFSSFPVIGSTINESKLDREKVTDYVGSKIYENGALKRILVDGGYYDYQAQKYYFFIKDYLGNNRVTADVSGNVIQDINYHAFGGTDPLNNYGESVQPYKHNGKELDSVHDGVAKS